MSDEVQLLRIKPVDIEALIGNTEYFVGLEACRDLIGRFLKPVNSFTMRNPIAILIGARKNGGNTMIYQKAFEHNILVYHLKTMTPKAIEDTLNYIKQKESPFVRKLLLLDDFFHQDVHYTYHSMAVICKFINTPNLQFMVRTKYMPPRDTEDLKENQFWYHVDRELFMNWPKKDERVLLIKDTIASFPKINDDQWTIDTNELAEFLKFETSGSIISIVHVLLREYNLNISPKQLGEFLRYGAEMTQLRFSLNWPYTIDPKYVGNIPKQTILYVPSWSD